MNILAICIAAATLGIDVGWQRLPEGGMEYIIQLDPQTLDALRAGEPVQSDIPPGAGEIRSYRIIVGAQELPRESPPAAQPTTPKVEAESEAAPQAPPKEPAKPWLPLTLTLFGLFASLGANVYLGWIAWESRLGRGCQSRG